MHDLSCNKTNFKCKQVKKKIATFRQLLDTYIGSFWLFIGTLEAKPTKQRILKPALHLVNNEFNPSLQYLPVPSANRRNLYQSTYKQNTAVYSCILEPLLLENKTKQKTCMTQLTLSLNIRKYVLTFRVKRPHT